MTVFALVAAVLLLITVGLLLPPLWRGASPLSGDAEREAANLAIFRDQLSELEREKAEGSLAETDFDQARRELQRRLLNEVQGEGNGDGATTAGSRPLAILLMVLLPALALGGYGLLGNPRAIDPAATAPRPKITAEQVEGMIAKLSERLKANPDDTQGWLMLARSYKVTGRLAEAAEAYGKVEAAVAKDPDLLTDYAETLAMSEKTGLKGKPAQLIAAALKIDAKHPHALLLAGAEAMERGDRKAAVAYWEALLPMVEPGSEMETMLRDGIDRLKQGGKPGKNG